MTVAARRQLAMAVLACAAGAAVVLLAAGRSWVTEVVARPAPLPDEEVVRTGGDLMAWLPALGWVALAGAGALLATRGGLRRGIGGLLALAGAGATVGAATGVASTLADAGRWGWPVLAAGGALVVTAVGVVVAARSGGWPAMGARYERRDARGARDQRRDASQQANRSPEQLWQALDRGEDPTA